MKCPTCAYNLNAITTDRCPECGERFVLTNPRGLLSRAQLAAAVGVFACVNAIASFIVVFKGANDEPYMVYRRLDAIVQVGIGSALIVSWVCLSLIVAILVATGKLSKRWLAVLILAAVCLFYTSFSPRGYLNDLQKHILTTGN